MNPYIVIEVKSLSVKTIRVEFHLLYECKFHMLDIMSSDRPRNWTQNDHTFQHISLSNSPMYVHVCMYVCIHTKSLDAKADIFIFTINIGDSSC